MAGPRVTGPVAKLARSITTSAQPSTLITSSKASAPLSRKYADLLKDRNTDPDRSRHLYTRSANLPHPQPRKMRLMQTFSSTATAQATAKNVDNIVFPGSAVFDGASQDPFSNLRVPLLPDNVMFQHAPESTDAPATVHDISIVAANPDLVSPSALTEIEGMGMDGVELKFIYDAEPAEQEPGMLTGLWRGLVDDVLSQQSSKGKLAL
ncbi:hypothetical protein F5B22DRAFT_616965 [Xylaria bambusicola]|uniref:uncharacterized protein n=1 Tax=Xylaria bambusicola TaxID=326684 RepID=UPI002008779D|nr:uncharacterized protein F5B22DRAFT_616965 [Xylaria bambusicola]KAI0509422.1 hypothetical protein F5B22DRAFT_616965 [Xylaria bambusicola]